MTAASHDPYLLCLEGSCFPNSKGEIFIYFASGTSASAPSFASIMALIDQQMANLNPAQGPRQGQANYVLYRLAASQKATLSQCDASNTAILPASTCIFNDVTVGNNVTSSTGFTGTITLSCSKLPAGAACQFAQPSITSTGTLTTITDTITVTTTAAGAALLRSPSHPHFAHWLAAGGFGLFSLLLFGGSRRQRPARFLALLTLLIMLLSACGGGGSSPPPPPPNPGTPTGTYNVVVTASSGSTTSTTGFTLVVQ